MEDMLSASIAPLLADLCTPVQLREIERDHAAPALWQALQESGFLDALVPEAAGGAGLSLDALAGVLIAFGHAGMPLPAAQTMLARQWLAAFDVPRPAGPITLAFASGSIDGTRSRHTHVPYGKVSDAILLETPDGVYLDDRLVKKRAAGSPSLLGFAALMSAASMAGAMSRIFEITMTQANERQQFGRSIGKFQAVQHQLSVMAEHIAAAHMAVRLACATPEGDNASLNRAIAKSRASHAAPLIADTAHALMGAIGITAEFDLQHFTRALRAERLHYGSEGYWDEIIGAHVIAHWQSITSGVVDTARCS